MAQNFIPLIYVLAFIAVVLLVQVLAGQLFAARARNQRINRRLTLLAEGVKPAEVYARLVHAPEGAGVSDPRLKGLHDRIWTYCRQAGLTIAPLRLLAGIGGGAAALWLLALLLLRATSPAGMVVNAVTALVGAVGLAGLIAFIVISGRRSRRLKKLEEQLPLALDIVNRALRAGHPVISAVQLAAAELGDPIGSEFGLIVDETTYGAEFKDALTNFARRTGSRDAHFFAVSVGIQSETGGNLGQILDGLAAVIRSRATLAKRVKALASEGKASAMILSVLPLFLIGLMLVFQPQFYTSKFSDPLFWPIAILILGLYLLGQFMITRIVNFKY